ncbi:MAG: hypothetical protein R3286_00775 [Gammaproteobacteria bacterium]|nr:hypothetical protein [Gammaproteobacteria bacterium]
MARGPAEERAAFARTALLTMAEQYREEIGKARSYAHPDPERRRKAARWSAATLRYLDDLYATADRIDDLAVIEVLPGAEESVQLLVDGMPVVLSGPRIADPDSLGRSIVEAFCRYRDCIFDTPQGPAPATAAYPARDDSLTGWDFGDATGSTFVTADGIHFLFASVRDRQRKERAAMDVVHDLRFLSDELRAAAARGHAIDWELVRIRPGAVAGEHKVIINRHGDYLMLRLPALGRALAIMRSSRSWLRGRVEGREVQQYFPRAETLLAPLLEG